MIQLKHIAGLAVVVGLLSACDTSPQMDPNAIAPADTTDTTAASTGTTDAFDIAEVTQFDNPWAMTFLPDGRLLVTEMNGNLHVVDVETGERTAVSGVPEVVHVEQGGLGDVVLHPQFADNDLVYISYVERGDDGMLGGVVARARFMSEGAGGAALEETEVLWRQEPKTEDEGHFGYRIVFDADGMLWISSSERREFDPAQDMNTNLGKIIRLNDDGSVPNDNPFADQGGVAAQVWSLGHRNILGMAFDANGRLWAPEMGPLGGDELNLIERGANYGYPIVSEGIHYDETPIPNHDTRPEFNAPVITWTPVISPAGFIIYDGDMFSDWQGSGFIGGLSSMALIRVEFDGNNAREAERFDMQRRIREVEQGPDGAIWLLEDGTRNANGWLLKLTPR